MDIEFIQNPHPVFNGQVRAALVERTDKPGMLGVAVSNGHYVCPLPEGYDGETSVIVTQSGYVIVGHPKYAPLLCDASKGTVQVIDPCHVEALAGRIKLLTH